MNEVVDVYRLVVSNRGQSMTSGLCCSLSSLQVNYATPKSGGRGGRGGGGGGKGRAGLVRGGWGGGGDKGRVESVRKGRVEGVGWGEVSKRRAGWRGRRYIEGRLKEVPT